MLFSQCIRVKRLKKIFYVQRLRLSVPLSAYIWIMDRVSFYDLKVLPISCDSKELHLGRMLLKHVSHCRFVIFCATFCVIVFHIT
jgi:hypothetical protein